MGKVREWRVKQRGQWEGIGKKRGMEGKERERKINSFMKGVILIRTGIDRNSVN